jgi:septum formation protein
VIAPALILASSSPRRASYLTELGFSFLQIAPEVDESIRRGETPRRYVRRLAEMKAGAVARRYPRHWVLGADTTVVVDGKILGKPADARDARRMLRLLSGRSHQVVSAIALAHSPDRLRSRVSTTRVYFRKLGASEIERYVETGEPMEKAGAYAIQGKGGILVSRIEGSFSNVVGFPLEKFFELWKEAGQSLPWLDSKPRRGFLKGERASS